MKLVSLRIPWKGLSDAQDSPGHYLRTAALGNIPQIANANLWSLHVFKFTEDCSVAFQNNYTTPIIILKCRRVFIVLQPYEPFELSEF